MATQPQPQQQVKANSGKQEHYVLIDTTFAFEDISATAGSVMLVNSVAKETLVDSFHARPCEIKPNPQNKGFDVFVAGKLIVTVLRIIDALKYLRGHKLVKDNETKPNGGTGPDAPSKEPVS